LLYEELYYQDSDLYLCINDNVV